MLTSIVVRHGPFKECDSRFHSLSRIFSLAIREKVARTNPAIGVQQFPEDNKRFRFLLAKEEKRLLAE
jgi:hypothetical protein